MSSSFIRRAVVWILMSLTMAGCLEPYLPSIIADDFGILVVDGFFLPNDTTTIKLSRSVTIDNPASMRRELMASVYIESEQGDEYRLTSKSEGVYKLPPVDANPASKYRLHVHTAGNNEYYSEFVELKSTHQLDSVTWTEEQKTNDVVGFDMYAHDPTNSTKYFMWEYDETYEYAAIDVSKYEYVNRKVMRRADASALYSCWKTNSAQNYYLTSTTALSQDIVYRFRLFELPQQSVKLTRGYSILVRQYALTEDAYNYLKIIKENSEKIGSLFDPVPSQPKSNIRCTSDPLRPAIGFFSATTVEKQRLFLNSRRLKGPSVPYDKLDYSMCYSDIATESIMTEEYMKNRIIFDGVFDIYTNEILGYIVFPKVCLDCREKGGVITKPDYWE